jgi:hypothetical protein
MKALNWKLRAFLQYQRHLIEHRQFSGAQGLLYRAAVSSKNKQFRSFAQRDKKAPYLVFCDVTRRIGIGIEFEFSRNQLERNGKFQESEIFLLFTCVETNICNGPTSAKKPI